MQIDVGTPKLLSGRVTQVQARCEGKVYSIDRYVEEIDEVFRPQIEEDMYREVFQMIYKDHIKGT